MVEAFALPSSNDSGIIIDQSSSKTMVDEQCVHFEIFRAALLPCPQTLEAHSRTHVCGNIHLIGQHGHVHLKAGLHLIQNVFV